MFFRFAAAALALIAAPLAAQDIPAPQSPYLNDFAQVLSAEDETTLTADLRALRDATGAQMTVATLDTLEGRAPTMSLESYARALFDDWGIGDADRNDGILLLVLTGDRRVRLELGAGYDNLWNSAANTVVQDHILPPLRADDWAAGIAAGVAATDTLIARPFSEGAAPPEKSNPLLIILVMVLGGGALVGFGIYRAATAEKRKLARETCPKCGRTGMWRNKDRLRAPTTSSKGEERWTTGCMHCSYQHASVVPVAMLSSAAHAGGTGGGFGGGVSGGGGASGSF